MSTPPWIPPSGVRQMRFFPNFFLRELMVWYVAMAILGALAAIFPWELGEKADPFALGSSRDPTGMVFSGPVLHAQADSQPHCGFWKGNCSGILGFGLLAAAWVALPFWGATRAGQARTRLVTGVGIAWSAYLATFTMLGYFR